MKTRAILLAIGFAALAVAVQDPVTLARTYKEGDKDNYKMAVTVNAMMTVDVSFTMAQAVKKVYDGGEADIETTVKDLEVLLGGNPLPAGAGGNQSPQPVVQRVDKYGRPVGAGAGGNSMIDQMAFLRYMMFSTDKSLTPGTSIDVDDKDEKRGSRTWGKVTLVKIENGIATVDSDLKMTTKDTGDKPMILKFSSLFETASGKPNKVEGTVTDLPANGQVPGIDSVKMVLERVK